MKLWIERLYPLFLASIAAYAWHRLGLQLPRDEKEFLGAAVSLGAILTGFIATAQAILAALPKDGIMSQLKSSGYINDLVPYLAQALYSCLTFSVISLGAFWMQDDHVRLPPVITVPWVFVAVFALCAFYRVSSTLFDILKR